MLLEAKSGVEGLTYVDRTGPVEHVHDGPVQEARVEEHTRAQVRPRELEVLDAKAGHTSRCCPETSPLGTSTWSPRACRGQSDRGRRRGDQPAGARTSAH